MKIGILTYHAVYNFGANLQALSTFCYLKKEGHEPVIIDFFPTLLEEAFDKSVPVEQADAHKLFLKKNFILTGRCRNSDDIVREIGLNKIEAVIIGSDAVVQHNPVLSRIKVIPSRKKILVFRKDPIKYETNFPNPFWGEFIEYINEKIPVAMMSVSCQNTDYKFFTGKERRQINKMVSQFCYISVRDNRSRELFKYVSKGIIIPKVTPDPVFAINDNCSGLPGKNEITKRFNLPDKYILLSFNSPKTVDKSWISAFKNISRQKGYECVALAMPGGIIFENDLDYRIDIPLDPLDWYCIIKYSSAYIGEKMHPIIVSLHNSVPFFSFDHYGILRFKIHLNQKASKIYHILERARLQDHRVSIIKKINYKPPSPEYVFNKVNSFSREDCTVFADRMLFEYKAMMKDIIYEFQK